MQPVQPEAFPVALTGQLQSGKGDASRWLALFNQAYSQKLGQPVFPGSLNLALDEPFDWFTPAREPWLIRFGRAEYGGERDILLLPCRLQLEADVQAAHLWSTTTAATGRQDAHVVEIVAAVGLRATYGLSDGDTLVLRLPA